MGIKAARRAWMSIFDGPDPVTVAARWLEEAAAGEPNDPNAMQLATVDDGGLPDVRTVLLKEIELPEAEGPGAFLFLSYLLRLVDLTRRLMPLNRDSLVDSLWGLPRGRGGCFDLEGEEFFLIAIESTGRQYTSSVSLTSGMVS